MASSKIARKSSDKAQSRALAKESRRYLKERTSIAKRFKDTGTSGAKEKTKRKGKAIDKSIAIDKKIISKGTTDSKNVDRYGKDAMKSRGFATHSNTGAKSAAKPKPKAKTFPRVKPKAKRKNPKAKR